MSQYTIDGNGNKITMSRYSIKGVCTLNTIFPSNTETTKKFLKKKKEFEKANLQYKYRIHDNSVLIRRIFVTFLLKVLARVANGELFKMPGTTGANITLKQIPDNEVKKLRKLGFYSDYDIVKSGFKIPRFVYDFGPFRARRDVGIHVPPTLMKHTLKNAENRQIQWTYIPKTFSRDV